MCVFDYSVECVKIDYIHNDKIWLHGYIITYVHGYGRAHKYKLLEYCVYCNMKYIDAELCVYNHILIHEANVFG